MPHRRVPTTVLVDGNAAKALAGLLHAEAHRQGRTAVRSSLGVQQPHCFAVCIESAPTTTDPSASVVNFQSGRNNRHAVGTHPKW